MRKHSSQCDPRERVKKIEENAQTMYSIRILMVGAKRRSASNASQFLPLCIIPSSGIIEHSGYWLYNTGWICGFTKAIMLNFHLIFHRSFRMITITMSIANSYRITLSEHVRGLLAKPCGGEGAALSACSVARKIEGKRKPLRLSKSPRENRGKCGRKGSEKKLKIKI